MPFTVTLTPSRLVGIWLFTKSDPRQMRESPLGARLEPLISTHVFGAMVGNFAFRVRHQRDPGRGNHRRR